MQFSYNTTVFLCLAASSLSLFQGCKNNIEPSYDSFADWKQANSDTTQQHCDPIKERVSFTTNTLVIDGIAKSMSGDIDFMDAQIDWGNRDVIWLTGAKVSVLSKNPAVTSDEFLCHSLVNFHRENQLPWKILTNGTDKRLFTFSQGISAVNFPDGFAIPLLANTKLSLGNQVLNLRRPELKSEVEFQIDIDFLKIGKQCKAPTVLYQQPIFVTKHTGGPSGAYNAADSMLELSTASSVHFYDTNFAHCGISYDQGYNPYGDNFGRKFTGHWTIAKDSLEVIATNVTSMLDLRKNTKIHAISMHVHPHAYALELVDKTTNTTLYKGMVHYDAQDLKRITSLDFYSSKEGISVFKDHEYQLISTYLNPEKEGGITAMATLFLYLAE